MGAYDDLIPAGKKPAGAYDDLIPAKQPGIVDRATAALGSLFDSGDKVSDQTLGDLVAPKQHVDALDSYTRGVMGSLHRTAGTVDLLGLPLAGVVDKVHALATGHPQTGAQDFIASQMVDPEFHAAQGYDIQPNEEQGFGGKVAGGVGALLPDLVAMLSTGGESEAIGGLVKPVVEQSIPRQVAGAVGHAVEHSARASLVPGVKAGVEQGNAHGDTSIPAALNDVLGGMAATTAQNTLPLAAGARPGAGLLEQILTKGGQGAVAMPAISGTMAAIQGHPYDAQQAGVDAVLGSLMAQAGGSEHAPIAAPLGDVGRTDAVNLQPDPVAERLNRAQAGLDRNAAVLGAPAEAAPSVDDLITAHLPPEVVQAAHSIPPEQAQAVLGELGKPADPDARFRRPEPAPAVTTPTDSGTSPERASLPAQDFVSQLASNMRMRSQEQAAQRTTATTAVQPPADPVGSRSVGGDLIKPADGTTGRLFQRGNGKNNSSAQALQLPNGEWHVRSRKGGQWQPWEARATFDASPTFGYRETAMGGGRVHIPGVGQVPVAKADTSAKQAPDYNPLLDLIARSGGISHADAARFGVAPTALNVRRGIRPLFRKGGMSLDTLAEHMREGGYFPEQDPNAPPQLDHNDVFDLVGRALSGETVAPLGDAKALELAHQRHMDQMQPSETTADYAPDHEAAHFFDDVAHEAGEHIEPGDEAEAKSLSDLYRELHAAGVPLDSILPADHESDGAYAARLHARLKEAVNGTDQQATNGDRADRVPGRGGEQAEPVQGADLADREGQPHQDARSVAEDRPGFALDNPDAARPEPAQAVTQSGLFAPPTRGEQVRAATESKDASRNGLGRDLVRPEQGEGELLAGDKPKQDSVAESTEAHDLTDAELTGTERQAIDRLRIDKNGLRAKLSRDKGESDADTNGIRDAVHKAVGSSGVKVEFVHGKDGLPANVREQLHDQTAKRGSEQRTAGLYVPGELPRVFVLTDVASTPEKAAFTAAHEIAGHHGLRALAAKEGRVGGRNTHAALDAALEMALQNPTVSAVADSMMRRRKSSDRMRMAEEALADLAAATRTGDYEQIESRHGVTVPDAQRNTLRGAIARFVERVKGAFNASGAKFTDAQVHSLLENAWKAAKAGGRTEGKIAEQTAYHGTPHRDIEKFSLHKIGTGEGRQAFGWGMYFASEKDIADQYRRVLTDRHGGFIRQDGSRIGFSDAVESAQSAIDGPSSAVAAVAKSALSAVEAGDISDAAIRADLSNRYGSQPVPAETSALVPKVGEWFREQGYQAAKGQLYKTEVPDDHDLLDFDKPLTEQPPAVRTKLDAIRDTLGDTFAEYLDDHTQLEFDDLTGNELMQALRRYAGEGGLPGDDSDGGNVHREVAEFMQRNGIPGLRYLDGNSRKSGEGSHNYVVWDEAAIGKPEGLLESTDDTADFQAHADDPPMPKVADLPSRRPGESQEAFTRRIANKGGDELRTLKAETDRIKSIGRANFKAMLAKQARMGDVADAVFHEYRKLFDITDKAKILSSIDQWETGSTVHDPDARNFFKLMDGMFADRIERLRKAKPEALKELVENYFPHLWEDSSKATKWYQSNTKRPLDGNKSFLKQRTWGTIKEGMDSGLKPVSYNPVDLALLKLQQMDKFITFHEFKNDLKARGWLKQVKAGERMPEGYATIDSPAFKGSHAFVIKGEDGKPDQAASAHWDWAVPESIAKDVNNYLSPSLYRFGAWKSLRYVQNVLMSTRLGFSAFHAGFTTTDNLVMHVDVAGRRLLAGDVAGGLGLLLKAPATVFLSPYEGGVLNKEWTGKQLADPHTAAVLTALEEGGATRMQGAQQMDYNNALPALIRSIRQKSAVGTLKSVLPAIGEASSYLIHQKLVPAQKMAARVMLLKFELDRLAMVHPELGKAKGDYAGIIEAMHPDTLKQVSGKVVNLVDDRLGQMNYDNQFWNKTAREASQALIGAVGWQVGTLRTVTGGAADLRRLWDPEALVAPLDKAGEINDAHMGRVSGRLTYLVSLAVMMGGLSAATQYLMTGQGPQEAKDYFFPKTGRKNPDDSDERLQFPSYWMDHYKLGTHPLQTIGHKLHPSIGLLMEAINNQDYYGVAVRDEDAPWYKQAEQVAQHVAEGFIPYSVSGQKKLDDSDASAGRRAANFVGVANAPLGIDRSKFQNYVADRAGASAPQGGRTQDQADHTDSMHVIEDALRKGESPDMSMLTAKERKAAEKAATLPVPALRFKRLSLEDKLRAWDMATPAERTKYKLRDLLETKGIDDAIAKLPPDDQDAVRQKISMIQSGPLEGYQ